MNTTASPDGRAGASPGAQATSTAAAASPGAQASSPRGLASSSRSQATSSTVAAASPGAQVVARVATILRLVSGSMPEGLTTTEIAARSGIFRTTVHRIATELAAQGFLDRSPKGRWLLGPELYIMGAVAAQFDVADIARPHVEQLAEATGESAFFSILRGHETVCLLREDGSFPIRSFVLYEGKRFPLGVASAGLVMLAMLPDREVNRFLASPAGADLVRSFGEVHGEAALRERLAATRATGYSVNPGLIVEGSWGLGAAVFDSAGRPAYALSLTGIEHRIQPRTAELGQLLLRHAHRLTLELQGNAARGR